MKAKKEAPATGESELCPEARQGILELRQGLSRYLGPLRCRQDVLKFKERARALADELKALMSHPQEGQQYSYCKSYQEALSLATLAPLICDSALERQASVGVHAWQSPLREASA